MDSNMWQSAFIFCVPSNRTQMWPCGQILDELTDAPLWSRGSQRSFCGWTTSLAACTESFHFVWNVVHGIGILFQIFIHIFLPPSSLRQILFSSSNQLPCRDFRRQMKIMQFSVISAVKRSRLNDNRDWPPPSSGDNNQPTLNLSVTFPQRPNTTEDHLKYR